MHRLVGRFQTGLPLLLALATASSLSARPGGAQQSPAPSRSFYSMRDALGESIDQVMDRLREIEATDPVETIARPTRAQAMAAARAIAQRRSTPKLRAFLDTTRLAPSVLRQLALYSAINGGEGVMAFLLAAERRQRGDWVTQHNIAVFLQTEGYPAASLAILDSLRAPDGARGPGDVDLQASLLLARGNALLDLGRPKDAIPLLKDARQREPMMVEAAHSLARALLLVEDEAEARRVLRVAGRRFPTQWDAESVEIPPGIADPTIEIPEQVLLDAVLARDGHRLSLNERWPLGKGREAELKVPAPPGSIDQLPAFWERLSESSALAVSNKWSTLEAVTSSGTAMGLDTTTRLLLGLRSRLSQDVALPWEDFLAGGYCEGFERATDPNAIAQNHRASEDVRFASRLLEDEELATAERAVIMKRISLCLFLRPIMDGEDPLWKGVGHNCAPGPGYRRCVCDAEHAIGAAQLAKINSAFVPYLETIQQWFRVAHHHSTAVAGYVEATDPLLRDYVGKRIEYYKVHATDRVLFEMFMAYGRIQRPCTAAEKFGTPPSLVDASAFGSCGVGDNVGVKHDLGIAKLKITCTEIELEGKLSTPGLEKLIPKVSEVLTVTWTHGGPKQGNLTIFYGAALDGPELVALPTTGAKAGGYVTFRDGEVTDLGFKVSMSESKGPFSVKVTSQSIDLYEIPGKLGGAATYVSNSFLAWRGE